jgi:hypothetical protein
LSLSHVCCTESLVLEAFEDSWCGGAESCKISVWCRSVGGDRIYSRNRRVPYCAGAGGIGGLTGIAICRWVVVRVDSSLSPQERQSPQSTFEFAVRLLVALGEISCLRPPSSTSAACRRITGYERKRCHNLENCILQTYEAVCSLFR